MRYLLDTNVNKFHWLSNEWVNVINTLIVSGVAILGAGLMQYL